MRALPRTVPGEDRSTAVRTFMIADIRGYSTFTRERGHAEAAQLAARFVDLASDAIEARGGRIVEIRGDEVLEACVGACQTRPPWLCPDSSSPSLRNASEARPTETFCRYS